MAEGLEVAGDLRRNTMTKRNSDDVQGRFDSCRRFEGCMGQMWTRGTGVGVQLSRVNDCRQIKMSSDNLCGKSL